MPGGRTRGFTLIEILAVVAILALLAALVAPNVGRLRQWAVRGEAERLAARLELARQRAIVTGVPHRLWLDLDAAEFRVEWWAPDPAEAADAPALDLSGNSPLSLEAPRRAQLAFRPIPGKYGNREVITDPFYVERLETPEGTVREGEAWIEFDREGTASYTEIYLEDKEGHALVLDVFPLDDRVRIRDEADA